MSSYRKAFNLPEKIIKTLQHLYAKNTGIPNCIEFNVPTTITTKIDGTNFLVKITLKKDEPEIELWGHSAKKYCFKGSLQKLQAGQVKGPNTIPYTYQYVYLYPIISEVVPKFVALMTDMNLEESHFYCEMTLPKKSPLDIKYPSDMLNKLYLFNHVYAIGSEYKLDEVNNETIKVYEKYDIRTVPLFKSFSNFTIEDFDALMDHLKDKNIEGFMLSQQNCLIKLKTHYYEASVPDMNLVMIDQNDQYQVMLKVCLEKYIKAIESVKTGEEGGNLEIIDIEIKKEYGHDDHSVFCKEYFAKLECDRLQFLKESDLTKRILESIEKEKGSDFVTVNYNSILKKINDFMFLQN